MYFPDGSSREHRRVPARWLTFNRISIPCHRRRRQIRRAFFFRQVHHHSASHPRSRPNTHPHACVHVYLSEPVHSFAHPREPGTFSSCQQPYSSTFSWNCLIEQNDFSQHRDLFGFIFRIERKISGSRGKSFDPDTRCGQVGSNRGVNVSSCKSPGPITLIFVIDSRTEEHNGDRSGLAEIWPVLSVSEVRPCLSVETKRLNLFKYPVHAFAINATSPMSHLSTSNFVRSTVVVRQIPAPSVRTIPSRFLVACLPGKFTRETGKHRVQ